MNNKTKIILGIVVAFFITMASCSGCALVTAGGYYLANKEKGEACKSTDRPASSPSKSQKPSNSKSSDKVTPVLSEEEAKGLIKPLSPFVTEFHKRFNEDDFSGMYDLFNKAFKKELSREDFTKLFSEIKDKVGDVKDLSDFRAKAEKEGEYVIITVSCKAQYTNVTLGEDFRFIVIGDDVTLNGFNIDTKTSQSDAKVKSSQKTEEDYY